MRVSGLMISKGTFFSSLVVLNFPFFTGFAVGFMICFLQRFCLSCRAIL
jgi:hypothetical protein